MPTAEQTAEQAAGRPRRLVVAMTGSSGTVYGLRLLERLRDAGVESHLVACGCARARFAEETGRPVEALTAAADKVYSEYNQAARISSGSYLVDGMVVAPCSTRAAAAIARGMASNLIHRAADVTLKEGRRLILLVREGPLSPIHLHDMLRGTQASTMIMPPVPSFFDRPATTDELVDATVGRLLDHFDIDHDLPR